MSFKAIITPGQGGNFGDFKFSMGQSVRIKGSDLVGVVFRRRNVYQGGKANKLYGVKWSNNRHTDGIAEAGLEEA